MKNVLLVHIQAIIIDVLGKMKPITKILLEERWKWHLKRNIRETKYDNGRTGTKPDCR